MDMESRSKKLVADIHGLSQVETEEIFKIVHESKCDYTRNNNGIFVNLAWLPENAIVQLENYVRFCNQSKKELKKYESLCDVLNHKMYAVEEGHRQREKTRGRKLPDMSTCDGYELDGDGIDDNDAESKVSRMPSSLRYHLLKKRYSKQQSLPTTNINHLSKEDYVV